MKAPDKIYLNIVKEYAETSDALDAATWDAKKWKGCVNVEYIRKDALLEWLEERINDGDEEGLMTNQIANLVYKDVIDKLNEP